MEKKKLAVRLAAPAALAFAVIAIPSPSGTAQAGAICAVVNSNAPLYAKDSVDSETVGSMDAGQQVAAVGPFSMWWRVARADDGEPLGYMQQADLNCSGR